MECRITPKRKHLFWSQLEGKLVLELTMYSLYRRDYAYAGRVQAEVSRSKEAVFFSPVSKVVHVTALERAELLQELGTKAVQISSRMIAAVIQNEQPRPGKAVAKEVKEYKVPSISDVFTVPSMQGRAVNQRKEDSTTRDSLSK